MISILINASLLGLSVGLFCFTYCVPFIAPYIVSEKREMKKNFYLLGEFIFGRLAGYLFFGALFGYFGERLTTTSVNLISTVALMVLSLFLLLYVAGMLKTAPSFCSSTVYKERSPILMGFLMGVNVCPPFLMSVIYVLTLHSVLKGMVYFLGFFLTSSIYLIPLAFLGLLSRIREIQRLARLSALTVSLLFLLYGFYSLARIAASGLTW